jgi:hypothetical protein
MSFERFQHSFCLFSTSVDAKIYGVTGSGESLLCVPVAKISFEIRISMMVSQICSAWSWRFVFCFLRISSMTALIKFFIPWPALAGNLPLIIWHTSSLYTLCFDHIDSKLPTITGAHFNHPQQTNSYCMHYQNAWRSAGPVPEL